MPVSLLQQPDDIRTATILLGLLVVYLFIFILDSAKSDLDLGSSHHTLLNARVVGRYYHAQSFVCLHSLSEFSVKEKLRFTVNLRNSK